MACPGGGRGRVEQGAEERARLGARGREERKGGEKREGERRKRKEEEKI